jgi:hypothetical protein
VGISKNTVGLIGLGALLGVANQLDLFSSRDDAPLRIEQNIGGWWTVGVYRRDSSTASGWRFDMLGAIRKEKRQGDRLTYYKLEWWHKETYNVLCQTLVQAQDIATEFWEELR